WRRPTRVILRAGPDQIPPVLAPVYEAITTTDAPRTALNWLRNGAGARLLAEMASGATASPHHPLAAHARPRAAAYLRAVLVANQVLPARDEQLATAEKFTTDT